MAGKRAFRLELYTWPIGGRDLMQTTRAVNWEDARDFLARLRIEMRALAQSGKCGVLTVAVHQDGEACDHE